MKNIIDNDNDNTLGSSKFFDQAYQIVEDRTWPIIFDYALNDRLSIAYEENEDAVEERADAAAIAQTGKSSGPDFETAYQKAFDAEMSKVYDAVAELAEDPIMQKCIDARRETYHTDEMVEVEIFRLENPETCPA